MTAPQDRLSVSTTGGDKSSPPFVSIVTPFYNTDAYLAQCIESVLAQTYSNWEYILVNNQSTDRSREIAERYVQRDSRLRLFDTPQHFTQTQNYEAALRRISPDSRYCKMVQADDWLFPECIERMVAVAETSPRIAFVTSYQLFGERVKGDGLPYPSVVTPGRDICRQQLLSGDFFFGSQTSILLRSDLVRAKKPFYRETSLHPDTETAYELLADHDMGFVHQILSFSRTDNDSITKRAVSFNPNTVDKYIVVKLFGRRFLDDSDYRKCFSDISRKYGHFLAESVFEFKGKAFWDYHRQALETIGCSFWSVGFPKYLLIELLDIIFNPKKTVGRFMRTLRNARSRSKLVDNAS